MLTNKNHIPIDIKHYRLRLVIGHKKDLLEVAMPDLSSILRLKLASSNSITGTPYIDIEPQCLAVVAESETWNIACTISTCPEG